MKIIYKMGDMTQGLEMVLAHGCNNRGVMASGVAKVIRTQYPKAYADYFEAYCDTGLKVGDVVETFTKGHIIFNCITQDGFGYDGKQYVSYDGIRKCMQFIDDRFNNLLEPMYVAFPMIGSTLGGGDWNIIEKIIEEESINFQPVVYKLE